MNEAAQVSRKRLRRAWIGAAIFVAGIAFAVAFDGFWGHPARETVPIPADLLVSGATPARLSKPVVEADYHLAVWAVARNAYTLLHRPLDLFQAEPCFPAADALTLHHPVLTLALIAAPVYALSGDPVLAFNASVFGKIAVGFAAMFLLVSDWTRSPAAGVAAALLYAFHPVQIDHPYHVFTSDNAWLLFGLFFARRLFARGRWSDALGLTAACWLQMASSFYPLFAAVVAAVPVAVWFCWHHRNGRIPTTRLLVASGLIAGFGALLFAPYLENAGGSLEGRGRMFYAAWSTFLPAGENFPGWIAAALLVAAFAVPRRRSLHGIDGDPRWALAVAAAVVALFAAGGNFNARLFALTGEPPPPFALPNPFSAMAQILPGLRTVRLPREFALVAREIACLLAGIGAAGALRMLPARWRTGASVALILAVFCETLRWPGLAPHAPFAAFPMRPEPDALAFFEQLEARGNRGPLLEIPLNRGNPAYTFREAPRQQLLSAYHHRRTSACYVSFIPESVRSLAALSDELPEESALNRLRDLGFTTIVIHHRRTLPAGAALDARFRADAEREGSALVRIAADSERTAYALSEGIR